MKTKVKSKKKKPTSPKLLAHIRKVCRLNHQRAVERRKKAEAKKAKRRVKKPTVAPATV